MTCSPRPLHVPSPARPKDPTPTPTPQGRLPNALSTQPAPAHHPITSRSTDPPTSGPYYQTPHATPVPSHVRKDFWALSFPKKREQRAGLVELHFPGITAPARCAILTVKTRWFLQGWLGDSWFQIAMETKKSLTWKAGSVFLPGNLILCNDSRAGWTQVG